jgi:hypothetical protein
MLLTLIEVCGYEISNQIRFDRIQRYIFNASSRFSKYEHTSQTFQTITESVHQEFTLITWAIPNFQLSLPIAKMLGKRMLRAPDGNFTGLRYECITRQHITVLGVSEVL